MAYKVTKINPDDTVEVVSPYEKTFVDASAEAFFDIPEYGGQDIMTEEDLEEMNECCQAYGRFAWYDTEYIITKLTSEEARDFEQKKAMADKESEKQRLTMVAEDNKKVEEFIQELMNNNAPEDNKLW